MAMFRKSMCGGGGGDVEKEYVCGGGVTMFRKSMCVWGGGDV